MLCVNFFHGTCCLLIFVHKTSFDFFSSWNLYVEFSPRETNIVHETFCVLIFAGGTCCGLIFILETCCVLILLINELLIFSLLKWFGSSNFLCVIYCTWNLLRVDFFLWNSLHAHFSLGKNFTLIFLFMKLFLFMELVARNFVHGTCCLLIVVYETSFFLIFSSWNLYIEFSPRETDYVHETLCAEFCSWNLLRANSFSSNLLHVDLCSWQ